MIPEATTDISDFIELEISKHDDFDQVAFLILAASKGHQSTKAALRRLTSSSDSFVKLQAATGLAHLGEEYGFEQLEWIALNLGQHQTDDYIPGSWIFESLDEVGGERAQLLRAALEKRQLKL